jgi:nitroreductase
LQGLVMIADLVKKNRSCRRFYQDHPVSIEILRSLVDLGRQSGSGGNLQPLKYIVSSESEKNDAIFSTLVWAAYLKNWPGPEEGERPSAYIIIFGDKNIGSNFTYDTGIASQSILLGATEMGLAGCMIAAFNRKSLRKTLNIPDMLEAVLVIAIGKPKENIVIEKVGNDNDIRYWRDDNYVHHVPKRSLDDIIVGSY